MSEVQDTKYIQNLMKRAGSGDTAAFGEVYDVYFAPIYRYVYFRVKNVSDAEDLTQAVFLKIYKTVDRFTDQGVSPKAFFFTVARNTIINFWRRKKDILVEKPEEMLETIPDTQMEPDRVLERKEAGEEVRALLKNLTPEQQEVLILKFINDLSNSEIATIMEKKEEAIRQLQSRGLRALRTQLKP